MDPVKTFANGMPPVANTVRTLNYCEIKRYGIRVEGCL